MLTNEFLIRAIQGQAEIPCPACNSNAVERTLQAISNRKVRCTSCGSVWTYRKKPATKKGTYYY